MEDPLLNDAISNVTVIISDEPKSSDQTSCIKSDHFMEEVNFGTQMKYSDGTITVLQKDSTTTKSTLEKVNSVKKKNVQGGLKKEIGLLRGKVTALEGLLLLRSSSDKNEYSWSKEKNRHMQQAIINKASSAVDGLTSRQSATQDVKQESGDQHLKIKLRKKISISSVEEKTHNKPITGQPPKMASMTSQEKVAKLKTFLSEKSSIIQDLHKRLLDSEKENKYLNKKMQNKETLIKELVTKVNKKKDELDKLSEKFEDHNSGSGTSENIDDIKDIGSVNFLKAALIRKDLELQKLFSEKLALEESLDLAKKENVSMIEDFHKKLESSKVAHAHEVKVMQQRNEGIVTQLKESDNNIWELLETLKFTDNKLMNSQAKFWQLLEEKDNVIKELEVVITDVKTKLKDQAIQCQVLNDVMKFKKKIGSDIDIPLEYQKKTNRDNIQEILEDIKKYRITAQHSQVPITEVLKSKNWCLFALAGIEDFEMLKIESVESLIILQNLERNINQQAYQNRCLKGLATRISSLQICLLKIYQLVQKFHTVFLPASIIFSTKAPPDLDKSFTC